MRTLPTIPFALLSVLIPACAPKPAIQAMGDPLTVAQAWNAREQLDGQRVRISGCIRPGFGDQRYSFLNSCAEPSGDGQCQDKNGVTEIWFSTDQLRPSESRSYAGPVVVEGNFRNGYSGLMAITGGGESATFGTCNGPLTDVVIIEQPRTSS